MATTKLSPTKLKFNTGAKVPEGTLVGESGMDLKFSGKDNRILITVTVAAATITSGNGIQGGGPSITVQAGQSIVLESGFFKHVSGEHKGCVYITGSTAKVSAVELP